jgi:ankyrin repeat protein
LLRHGAKHDPLPMVDAAVSDDPTVMRRFLAMGGDPNFRDKNGRTPLMEARGWAQDHDNTELIALLLAAGAVQ